MDKIKISSIKKEVIHIKIKEKIKEWLFSSEILRIKQLENQIEEFTNRLRLASIQLGNSEKEIEECRKCYFNKIEGKGVYKPEYILSKYPTFEYYLEQQSQFSTYALLTSDGIWHEPGRMGWFGCSTATSEDEIKYENEYKEKVLAEDPESYFVMVDCHI